MLMSLYVHRLYWSLASYERQRAFIAQHVEQSDVKQAKPDVKPRRQVANTFFFTHKRKEYRVCKTFFAKTLDITSKLVDYTMKKTESGVYIGTDERGKREPVNKTKEEDLELVRLHINSFTPLDGGRGKKDKNKKRYLSSDLNIVKMYNMYKEKCEANGHKPVGVSVYRITFKQDFNLAFAKPKKETCANCKCGAGEASSVKKKAKDDCAANVPGNSGPSQGPPDSFFLH